MTVTLPKNGQKEGLCLALFKLADLSYTAKETQVAQSCWSAEGGGNSGYPTTRPSKFGLPGTRASGSPVEARKLRRRSGDLETILSPTVEPTSTASATVVVAYQHQIYFWPSWASD